MWLETTKVNSAGEAGKQMSHSTVEKQRRDRINSLIDQLREIVPARSPNGNEGVMDSKRPKHIVLSDTIALVKHLQWKESTASLPEDPSRGGEAEHMEAHLPLAPEGAASASGIVIEEGQGALFIKVHCKDRGNLLLDVITVLNDLRLQVTAAAVTTTQEGNVFDVFSVKWPGEQHIGSHTIQQLLYNKLWPQDRL